MSEIDRLRRHRYEWPHGLNITPATTGWIDLMNRRRRQLRQITSDVQMRWVGFQDWAQSATLVPNYTKQGFELRRAPPRLHAQLKRTLLEGLPTARPETYGPSTKPLLWPQPNIVPLPYARDVLHSLQPLHEEWSGRNLTPVTAYGLRVYGNGSQLLMHHDNVQARRSGARAWREKLPIPIPRA